MWNRYYSNKHIVTQKTTQKPTETIAFVPQSEDPRNRFELLVELNWLRRAWRKMLILRISR